MNIGAISENKQFEKRISITPEIVKKYNKLGFKVIIEKDYGSHLGFSDQEYKNNGAQIALDKKEVFYKYYSVHKKSDYSIKENWIEHFKDRCIIPSNQFEVGYEFNSEIFFSILNGG